MERVESLINRLYQQSAAKASAADLLATTELLYKELAKHGTAQIAANIGSVAVWLPKGFGQAEPNKINWDSSQTNGAAKEASPNNTISVVANSPKVAEPTVNILPKEEPVYTKTVVEVAPLAAEPVVPIPTVDETPTVSFAAETPEELPDVETVKEEYPLVFQLDVVPSDEEIDAALAAEKKKKEEETALQRAEAEAKLAAIEQQKEPVYVPPTPPVTPKPLVTKPFPGFPDIADVMKKVFPAAPPPTVAKKEVNELITDPSAPGLNDKLGVRGKEVADVLATSGSKINDIRKAISINEKYQMISSLFRGDEDMFERCVRTLNNFGSLPEARFWMQRELVVKMGWNDEDELVQSFYRLVSRRFS
jgi:hypothetical protein